MNAPLPPPTVALVGANGHGLSHRRELTAKQDAGLLRVVALCDLGPIADAPDAPIPSTATTYTDHRVMLANARPDVVIICTPPHTHLAIATDAARAGCDILLEKPPVLSLAEHDELTAVLADTGQAAQVGFQALGSAALSQLLAAIGGGSLGTVTGIAAVASWQRADRYYARAPWAGRRTLHGRPVVDGALVNPLAHALMQSLAVAVTAAGSDELASIEVERYRTRPIEVEDTGFLRARTHSGLPITIAVTVCGEEFIAGEIIVTGTAGQAVLEYPTDRLALPGATELTEVPGRVSLLDNLFAHRATGAELIVPLARTRSFTALLETIVAAPEPVLLGPPTVAVQGEHRVIGGINDALRACAARHALPHELGLTWAHVP